MTNPRNRRPERLGRAAIDYSQCGSILVLASGFMKRAGYDYTMNPYHGCGFGCSYCYARFFAARKEDVARWGEWVRVKDNAVTRLERDVRRGKLRSGATVYLGSVTDPYQPVERPLELTRALLQVLVRVQTRLTIQTRSPLAERDLDLFAEFSRIRVNVTITTDSDEVRKQYEPWCPNIEERFRVARAVAAAGIPLGISISPMLPVSDAASFAQRLAELGAAEYVTQYMKPARSRFQAGTTRAVLEMQLADGWTPERYREARAIVESFLGQNRPLLEGSAGYRPA